MLVITYKTKWYYNSDYHIFFTWSYKLKYTDVLEVHSASGIAMMIELSRNSETSVCFSQTTLRCIPWGFNLYSRSRDNLKSHIVHFFRLLVHLFRLAVSLLSEMNSFVYRSGQRGQHGLQFREARVSIICVHINLFMSIALWSVFCVKYNFVPKLKVGLVLKYSRWLQHRNFKFGNDFKNYLWDLRL
jgi:hypothetical protein